MAKNAAFPRNILITGASSGLGEALALHYAAPDVFLALSGRNEERLLNVAAACRAKGAVRFYGEALRGAIKETGVKVNVICPGFVKSRMTDANDFHMPFLMEADRAASIIAKGLAADRGRIAFPFPTHLGAWFISVLPDCIAQKLLRKLPAKPRA